MVYYDPLLDLLEASTRHGQLFRFAMAIATAGETPRLCSEATSLADRKHNNSADSDREDA
jgi:hypothetical protein